MSCAQRVESFEKLELIKESFAKRVTVLVEQEHKNGDALMQCGSAVLSILKQRPEDALAIAHEKLHSFPYKDVPACWRRLYTEATLRKVISLEDGLWPSETVKALDMAIILTGAPDRYNDYQSLLQWLGHNMIQVNDAGEDDIGSQLVRVGHFTNYANGRHKRRKICTGAPQDFPKAAMKDIKLDYALPRMSSTSLAAFEKRINSDKELRPFIITDTIGHWPAIDDPARAWSNPQNLLRQTLGGRRIVPVELGRSYTDENWGQKLMPFSEYMTEYMLQDPSILEHDRKTGYLAQHDLFAQIPELRSDICIPDFCYATTSGVSKTAHDGMPNGDSSKIKSGLEVSDDDSEIDRDVLLNAWFGPAHTISPLHTDPHHNILAQAVGSKYIRLYAPSQSGSLYPRRKDGEVDMSNTSQVDVDFAMKAFEGRSLEPGSEDYRRSKPEDTDVDPKDDFAKRFPKFFDAEYVEGILSPGECLFVPQGWWHYVRSLSASCSVSFWWD